MRAVDLLNENAGDTSQNVGENVPPTKPPISTQQPQNTINQQHPNQKITDETYPIRNIWLFKSLIYLFLVSLIAFPFIFITVFIFPFLPIYNWLERKNFHYTLDDKYFKIWQGILSKQERNVPYAVIQNVILKQDLLDRAFGMVSLSIENAAEGGGARNILYSKKGPIRNNGLGFRGNRINIPGLYKQHAEELKMHILEEMQRNPAIRTGSGL